MTNITLTPSKQVDFSGVLSDLQTNIEPILGSEIYDYLCGELDKLHDLYIKLENEKESLEKEVDDLNEEVENLQEELESKE